MWYKSLRLYSKVKFMHPISLRLNLWLTWLMTRFFRICPSFQCPSSWDRTASISSLLHPCFLCSFFPSSFCPSSFSLSSVFVSSFSASSFSSVFDSSSASLSSSVSYLIIESFMLDFNMNSAYRVLPVPCTSVNCWSRNSLRHSGLISFMIHRN